MVKALFPIGKTQWAKWNDAQRTAFNEACAEGMSLAAAVKHVNGLELVEVNIAPQPVEAPEANARFGTVEELMADLNDEPTLAPAPQKPAPKKPRTPAKKGK